MAGKLKNYGWRGLILGQALILEHVIYYNMPCVAYPDWILIDWGMGGVVY